MSPLARLLGLYTWSTGFGAFLLSTSGRAKHVRDSRFAFVEDVSLVNPSHYPSLTIARAVDQSISLPRTRKCDAATSDPVRVGLRVLRNEKASKSPLESGGICASKRIAIGHTGGPQSTRWMHLGRSQSDASSMGLNGRRSENPPRQVHHRPASCSKQQAWDVGVRNPAWYIARACGGADCEIQTGGISLSDGLPTVIQHALHSLATLKVVRAELRGATALLAGIVDEATRLAAALTLINDTPRLQAPDVCQRCLAVTQLAAWLSSTLMVMAADSRRQVHPRELEPGGQEWACLEGVWSQLREARNGLEGSVAGVYVGLRGDVREGFRVERKALMGVGERVREVMGVELVLYARLRGRLGEGGGKLIKLDDADAARLGLPQTTSMRVEQWRAGLDASLTSREAETGDVLWYYTAA
ncbi:hypothetical protein VTI74DRAFT_3112 [Chaetomium olivicolor]